MSVALIDWHSELRVHDMNPRESKPVFVWSLALFALCGHLLVAIAWSQPASGQPPESAEQPRDAQTLDVARTAVESATVDAPAAILRFQNRQIVELRATVLSRTPAMRATAAERFLSDLADESSVGRAAARPIAGAFMISVGGRDVFALVPADADPLGGATLDDAAGRAVAALQLALDEAVELRTPSRIAVSAALALAATVTLLLLLGLLVRGHRWLATRISSVADRQLHRLPGGEVLRVSRVPDRLRQLLTLVSSAVGLVLGYSWLTFVLRRFPYTRPWGEALRGFLLERLMAFGGAFVAAIPDAFSVLLIVVVTRFAIKLTGLLFEAARQRRISLAWVHPDTAQTTRRLVTLLLWLFALALGYPHLPGSDTDAFKGVSVFVGLMISLGSSGLVNQVMSGLTLTYSRAVQMGDVVRIGDAEGIVTNLGLLATKLRTPQREEVTIPNTVMVSTVTTNYSRLQTTDGVFVPTAITIGYDIPWRQVHALLLLAAERADGVRREPAPFVRQTGLRDFYVEYTLLVCLEDPASKAPVVGALHGHIQDAFNEYGVQIMSPNYEADPSGPKVVPRDQWFAAPAVAPTAAFPPRGRKPREGSL